MKLIYTLSTLSLLGLFSVASAAEECKGCDDSCDKKKEAKSEECCKGACDATAGTKANYVVTGMTCEACANKVKTTLTAVDGVTVKSVCHKTGKVVVDYDAAKTTEAQVTAAIKSTGFKVAQ